jgi:hypothetical protein
VRNGLRVKTVAHALHFSPDDYFVAPFHSVKYPNRAIAKLSKKCGPLSNYSTKK